MMNTQNQHPASLFNDAPDSGVSDIQNAMQESSRDYLLVAKAIEFLSRHVDQQPSLDEIAANVHLSKFHFQRLFKRWAGITPTQFLHYLTVEHAKEQLSKAESVFNTSLEVGLSGAGRLHDLFVNIEAMTPGEYKQQGKGLAIDYGFHETLFGTCLLAATERGICALRFLDEAEAQHDRTQSALAELREEWPAAKFQENLERTGGLVEQVFNRVNRNASQPLPLLIKGTNFQINVWKALLAIPSGSLVTYQDVAAYIDKPKAVRAVASAVARNPIGYIVPCHRVISKAGTIHKYRWGETRKKAIVGWENAVSGKL